MGMGMGMGMWVVRLAADGRARVCAQVMLGHLCHSFAAIGRQCFNFFVRADMQIAIKKPYATDDAFGRSPRSTPIRLQWEAGILEQIIQKRLPNLMHYIG